MSRTRVKICGLTRAADVEAAVAAGADALGFVCYVRSPRYVQPQQLAELARAVPAFVVPTLLFVNARADEVRLALEHMPHALLQFHGDETASECAQFARPFIRAVHLAKEVDLLDCERQFSAASALLADAPSDGYGGSGQAFDWSMLPAPERRTKPLILAGGLDADNVGAAIARVRPYAVDVSSGVEQAKGIKSHEKLRRFIAAVRIIDQSLESA
jgi:phosphoribosylanthranilate isomerase